MKRSHYLFRSLIIITLFFTILSPLRVVGAGLFPATLGELKNEVKLSYESRNGGKLTELIFWDGADAEVVKSFKQAYVNTWGGLAIESIEVYPFNKYSPRRDLPGELNGRRLKWLVKPTYWIVIKASGQKEQNGKTVFKAQFELAVCEVDHSWRISGATYAD